MPRVKLIIERDSGDHETYGDLRVPNMQAAYILRDEMLTRGLEVATSSTLPVKPDRRARKKAIHG